MSTGVSTPRRYLSKTNSHVCKWCETRRHNDDLKQGGGFNNFECLDKVACAKAANRADPVTATELRREYVWSKYGKGHYR